jgi:dTDP-L-rhamnose 4-epimerase
VKRHLIVGGAGFIGTSLIDKIGAGDVTVFDSFSPIVHNPESIRDFVGLGAEFIVGDVSARHDLEELFENGAPETLVYLAAETGTGRSLYNCELNARVNTLGLAMLLDILSAKEAFPKRIILTSTRAVYGEGPYETADGATVYPEPRSKEALSAGKFEFEGITPLKMNIAAHAAQPINIYGATKLSQEHLLKSWCSSFDIPLYLFRLQNVYGAGQSLTNPYTGVLIHFIKQALNGDPAMIFENGGITRDFVHVDDVARLLAEAADGRGEPGSYDCGSGIRDELFDVAALLAEAAGGPAPKLNDQYRLGDVRHACADIERTLATFNWKPQVTLKEGLDALAVFVKQKLS